MNNELEITKIELVDLLKNQKDDYIIHVQLEVEEDENAKEDI